MGCTGIAGSCGNHIHNRYETPLQLWHFIIYFIPDGIELIFVIYSVLLTWPALVVNCVQQERAARYEPRRQRRQQQNDRAKLARQFLKRNGRLEGMIRLVDGAHDYEGLHIMNPLYSLVFSFSITITARTVVF